MSFRQPSSSVFPLPFHQRARLKPVAHAIALLAFSGMTGLTGAAQAQQAFSAGWMAQKNMAQGVAEATGRLPNGQPASMLTSPQAQQQRANQELQRSLGNLNLAAQGIAAQQAAQAAARRAAQGEASVPDGLAEGGLKVDSASLTAGWLNAERPQQGSTPDGRTSVTIRQTGDKAILNWETFNVGKATTVEFQQQKDWAVLNRVNDPQARPSRIQGQIKADGTVLVVNRNGVVFGGTSQVDTRNLVVAAANMSDAQFQKNGIYSAQAGGQPAPAFTEALGKVEMQPGARIATRQPASVTQGGGYVLLLGTEVHNAGEVATPRGQALLAAGDGFIIRKGAGTVGNTFSTTRGNEVAPRFAPDSTAGLVRNSGLMVAAEGDVTLAGRDVRQDGVALATTTVNTRGTVHLLNAASDTRGTVTVGRNAVTAVLLDADRGANALDSQREAFIKESADLDRLRANAEVGVFDNLSRLQDRRDLSRIEIVSGGDARFEGDSLTLATGGQVSVSATRRAFVAKNAQLDVSGAVGVSVAMAANNVLVNIQGNEQRDAPLNRDTGKLNNASVWIDRRRLTYVPAKAGVYDKDRWYTAGGLLEVGGYLGNQPHSLGEWMAQGGTVVLGGREVVTQAGSAINLSGGTLDVQTGYLNQSWLKGSDGRLYRLDKAPSDVVFDGLYRGFEDEHARWGRKSTGYFYNPLIGPQRQLENGYTVGRDAGRLVVNAPTAVLEGDIAAQVFTGAQQTQARGAANDGYVQPHGAVAQAGTLALRRLNGVGADGAHDIRVRIGDVADIGDTLGPDAPRAGALPADRVGTVQIDARRLAGFGLGGLTLVTAGEVSIERPLQLADGGRLDVLAARTRIDADVTIRSGDISVGNVAPVMTIGSPGPGQLLMREGSAAFVLGEGARLDLRGRWTNHVRDGRPEADMAFADGGSLTVRMIDGAIALERGSVVDVSSGATMGRDGKLRGARGGDVSLQAGARLVSDSGVEPPGSATLRVDGLIRSEGVLGGGTLTLESPGGLLFGRDDWLQGGVLAAGAPAPTALRLANPLRIGAGERLPMDLVLELTVAFTDAPLPPGATPVLARPLDTAAAWTVPTGFSVYTAQGYCPAGTLLPAGTRITGMGQLPVGGVLPSAVFPQGIPIQALRFAQAAGKITPLAVTYAAGSDVARGTHFAQEISFQPVQQLAPELLRSGFSSYRIASASGVRVAGDAVLHPQMPVLRANAAARDIATGADPQATLESWLPPLYLEDPARRRLTQRGGADLSLQGAVLEVAQGARIEVDAGRKVRLMSAGQLTMEGRIVAPGGDIVLVTEAVRGPRYAPGLAPADTAIWIGGDAVLDAAGRAYTAIDSAGLRYGVAPGGGSVRIGMDDFTRADRDFLSASRAFVVLRPGARLDASGSAADIDVPADSARRSAARSLQLVGDGGLIRLGSSRGIVNDASLRAAAGGEGAAGGVLSLALDNPPSNPHRMVVFGITQDRVNSGAAAGLRPGMADASLADGRARISVAQVREGGFGTLDLWSRDLFSFEGDVDLRLPEALMLRRGVLSVADTSPRARVSLAAPYVLFDGKVPIAIDQNEFMSGLQLNNGLGLLSAARNDARLSVEADLIDVRGLNFLGGSGATLRRLFPNSDNFQYEEKPVDAAGFDAASLTSRGDLRFTNGLLASGGDMTVTAAQIYPTTGASGEMRVGMRGQGSSGDPLRFDEARTLTLRAYESGGKRPATPPSVFGSLTLAAAQIDHGGVLSAPLGTILFGIKTRVFEGSVPPTTQVMNVLLRDGSITSTSARGLDLPYGGTVDGLNYLYNGQAVRFSDLAEVAGDPSDPHDVYVRPGIVFSQTRLDAQPGSLVDISGGGQLRGAGFFTGRGGSVDVLRTPLVNANPAHAFSSPGAGVFAIVPGFDAGYAPVLPDMGAGAPRVGQQVRFDAPVGGLPAGTYTLLPSTFALLPGAWRVELGARGEQQQFDALRASGSQRASGYLGIANTGVRDALPTAMTLTPGQAVRSLSQYNETGYADFALANAAAFDRVRPRLERDAQSLHLHFGNATGRLLSFAGRVDLDAAPGGLAGNVFLTGSRPMEVLAPGAAATSGYAAFDAAQLSAFNAGTLIVGGLYGLREATFYDPNGGLVQLGRRVTFSSMAAENVVVREGAHLSAGQIFLVGRNVRVERGALLDTTQGPTNSLDSSLGYLFWDNSNAYRLAILTVANGRIDFSAPDGTPTAPFSTIRVDDGAMLRTRGTIGFLTTGPVSLGEAEFNARYLSIAAPTINVGTLASFAAAESQGVLGSGVRLSQGMLERLLRPGTAGQARVERLSLTAGDALRFFGAVDLDMGAAGADDGALLVLAAPAIQGWGTTGDTARVVADTLVWSGLSTGLGTPGSPFVSRRPGAVVPGGAGTGSGRLAFEARRIEFGDASGMRGQDQVALDRLVLGFSSVSLDASERITANRRNTLSVFERGTDAATGSGGELSLRTPLLTGEAGSSMVYRTGGAVRIGTPVGVAPAGTSGIDALGADIRLAGRTVALDTAVALPGGRLAIDAAEGIRVDDNGQIDLAGRALRFFDVTRHSSGGELVMETGNGAIEQAAGSRIDVSAAGKPAGAVRATAVGNGGRVSLMGRVDGGSPSAREAGSIDIRAGVLDDFSGLNQRLNAGGVIGARRFVVKTGDIVIGDELRANRIEVSADGGSLTVNGRVDASGDDPGTIRLAARDDLQLSPRAVLDARGTQLRLDGRGQVIEAMNRGQVELASAAGTVRLEPGAAIDLRSADAVPRGELRIAARRIGTDDVAVSAPAGVVVQGAASIAVDAFARYTPADGVVDQAYFDTLHADSTAFIDAAGANGALRTRLAGLAARGDAFHLRPGVEIRSTGDLTVSREIDFSGYRYGPGVDAAVRGSGEPGTVVMRAGGNLIVNGSISDGFEPPPVTPDDGGWTNRDDGQGRMMAVAGMLAPGMRSWSMRLVSGADLGSADSRTVQPKSRLSEGGDLLLDDPHQQSLAGFPDHALSVVRTGTGFLELLAGGDYRQKSLFGVYTAGTQIAGSEAWDTERARAYDGSVLGGGNEGYEATLNARRMYFTQGGGDLLLSAQGDVRGFMTADSNMARTGNDVGRWLWLQGGAGLGQSAAWGINFGQYRLDGLVGAVEMVGFSGIGTLGGGHLTVRAGGDAGSDRKVTMDDMLSPLTTPALDLVVAGTGRMTADGRLLQTGGGRLTYEVGGRVNTGVDPADVQATAGQVVNLRGDTWVRAGSIGQTLETSYGLSRQNDPRAPDPRVPRDRLGFGPLGVIVGDGTVRIEARGDLNVSTGRDAGRVPARGGETQAAFGGIEGAANNWFTLWTDRSGIELFAGGGDILQRRPYGGSEMRYDPGRFIAVAANGSITTSLTLAPSRQGQLELLARDHVFGDPAMSGGSPDLLATPEKPLWQLARQASNYYLPVGTPSPEAQDFYEALSDGGVLFGFGADRATNLHRGDSEPIRIYAKDGDVTVAVGRRTQRTEAGVAVEFQTIAAKRMEVRAGRDILLSGVVLNTDGSDITLLKAGRDILNLTLDIGGPGLLSVSAGRNIQQQGLPGAAGTINSIGPVVEGDARDGAAIVLAAGMGAKGGPDYAGFAARYFDAKNLADAALPLADQAGKVARTYEARLLEWMRQRFGYAGDAAGALAAFLALGEEQQGVLVREVYFEELRQSGREYNDAGSRRAGSYLRGRNATAVLLPRRDAQGQAVDHQGSIKFQGAAGVHTDFGGGIQVLAPGGGLTVGANGVLPPPSTGLLTQGKGDIEIYTRDSVLLGLSRIFTTFGGGIVIWSAEGDINAGRGSKTTVVYTPPKREYDMLGNVKLSPNVPSTGAGIATLAPIAEVPAGDVDLIAPLGTIDAGEAGIRVSGNVNLAALHVVNAANIQVKGESSGLPAVAAVNVGALTNASAAASQASAAAQDVMQRERNAARQALPSVFTVRVLGFGNEPLPGTGGGGADGGAPRGGGGNEAGYRKGSAVQVLGDAAMGASERNQLTPAERRSLGL
ncbi:filamentous hemagglutinin [Variovorax sp. KBW07]|uniref:filamentous haemagglutinin family protein n=1 Tax=Variovorax sp. KBW07 TaxID=2153358 RepID=UPI000F581B02|nr:filamentous haemagglutinin family protein [Variovorax sp. KBW07]RQO63792.1 filamentous hemagglutinin [Variovorax sp. KBW07]